MTGGLDGRSVGHEARKSLAVQGRCRRRLLAFTGSALNFVTSKVGSLRDMSNEYGGVFFNRSTSDLKKIPNFELLGPFSTTIFIIFSLSGRK